MQKLGDHSKYCRGRNQIKLKGLFVDFLPASDEFGQIPAWVGKFCAGILAPSFSDGLSEEALQHPAEQQEKSRAHRSSSRLRKGRTAAFDLAALHLQKMAQAASRFPTPQPPQCAATGVCKVTRHGRGLRHSRPRTECQFTLSRL
jgi:hypothetical protein